MENLRVVADPSADIRTLGAPNKPAAGGALPGRGQPLVARRHPLRFLAHYVARHPIGHAVVVASVLAAVACSVSTQYGMKRLIDAIAAGPHAGGAGVGGVRAAVRPDRRR